MAYWPRLGYVSILTHSVVRGVTIVYAIIGVEQILGVNS